MNPANKKCFFSQRLLTNLVKLTLVLGLVGLIYLLTDRSDTNIKEKNNHRRATTMSPIQWIKESSSNEQRIAQHFAADTLPGLMRRGLIKRYERHQSGNIIFVEGKVWKARSRFFKESLLSEALVYNKVNGYALETRIVDHRSQQLYACAISTDRKEFFD